MPTITVPADVRPGDLVFQRSATRQSAAIAEATGSEYTHMGVIFAHEGVPVVLEAVEPVKLTPLADWVARGTSATVVRRLADADTFLTPDVLAKMEALGRTWLGRHYDSDFAWTDDRMYCSELAWKLYEQATGRHLGELRPLSSYRLTGDEVRKQAAGRFPDGIPVDQLVIAPQDVFDAPGLVTVP